MSQIFTTTSHSKPSFASYIKLNSLSSYFTCNSTCLKHNFQINIQVYTYMISDDTYMITGTTVTM